MHTREKDGTPIGWWTTIALVALLLGPGGTPLGPARLGPESAPGGNQPMRSRGLHVIMQSNGDLLFYEVETLSAVRDR
jgi:hypothetical protein